MTRTFGPAPAIRPIETTYSGVRFRSRLEARWAVFFDQLGIQWEYEPDAYATSAGNYLPDFRIVVPNESDPAGYWFEVKPDHFSADPRHGALAVESGLPLILARGLPRSYDAQMLGPGSPLRAYVGSHVTPCAFVGALQGIYDLEPLSDGRVHRRFIEYTRWPGTWDLIHKNRVWVQDAPCDVHVALMSQFPPCASLDVDQAFSAANSARFGR